MYYRLDAMLNKNDIDMMNYLEMFIVILIVSSGDNNLVMKSLMQAGDGRCDNKVDNTFRTNVLNFFKALLFILDIYMD